MANTLQLYFPQLRERQQVIDDILSKENLKTLYETWNEEQQKHFLDNVQPVIRLIYYCDSIRE